MTIHPSLAVLLIVAITSLVRIFTDRRRVPESDRSRRFEFSRDLLQALAIVAFFVPLNSLFLWIGTGVHIVLWMVDLRATALDRSQPVAKNSLRKMEGKG